MFLPLETFAPSIKIGIVSASRNCFKREMAEARARELIKASAKKGIILYEPPCECMVIESRIHASSAAAYMKEAGCDAAVLFLGNFSPEIEDALFIKEFGGNVLLLAAAEDCASELCDNRGDALCGLLSAALAIEKRGLSRMVHIPENPLINAAAGGEEIARFASIMKVVKGIRSATIGLFGPRPRDFETCNYNIASILSLGVEVEEYGFFDLANEVKRVEKEEDLSKILSSMEADCVNIPDKEFGKRIAAYEKAILNLRKTHNLSGVAVQCWIEQERALRHTPCYIYARMAARGFPAACENDAYSVIAELMGQYATGAGVTVLDLNHSIPADLHPGLAKFNLHDVLGLFHCGNTDPKRLKHPQIKHSAIMKRGEEPDGPPEITRGTLEGTIAESPITVIQVHGSGDRMRAYIAEGEFLDMDPMTFGSTGVAHIPGFARFYRHALLGRFHHHAAVAFGHVGGIVFDALKLLGVTEIYTPQSAGVLYPGENPFSG